MFRPHEPVSSVGATPLQQRPAIRFSGTGFLYIMLMLFLGIAAINSQANLLFGMFGLMVGVLLVSGVISRLVLRGLTLNRRLPEHAIVAQPVTVNYQFTNRKRFWPSLSVTLAELDAVEAFTRQPHTFLLHAAANATASVPVELLPKRRGLHTLNRYQLFTGFPFGFVKRAVISRQKESVVIYPAIGQVSPKLLAMCRSAENAGEVARPQPGGADEFYGVRDFRPGDNPRWIYWRRSARAGTLVAKEMTRVVPPRILLMVDCHVEERTREQLEAVERCIAMAASLAAEALDHGFSVGLSVWSGEWISIQPKRGKRQKSEILSVLAQLPLNRDNGLDALSRNAKPLLRNNTTGLLFTPHEARLGDLSMGRSNVVPVCTDSPRDRSWFKFDTRVDFASSMPVVQQPILVR